MYVGQDKQKAIQQALANAKSSSGPWRIFLNFKDWHVESLDNIREDDIIALPDGKVLEAKEIGSEVICSTESGVRCYNFFTRQRMSNVALQVCITNAVRQIDGFMFCQFGGAKTERLITVVADVSKMISVLPPAAVYRAEIDAALRKWRTEHDSGKNE